MLLKIYLIVFKSGDLVTGFNGKDPRALARVSLHWLANHRSYDLKFTSTSSPSSKRKLPNFWHGMDLHFHMDVLSLMP